MLSACDKCGADEGHWPSCPNYPGGSSGGSKGRR